jgi:uncharacterized protein (TIGR00369 family)
VTCHMSPPDHLRDQTGAVVPGALAILADTALGQAISTSLAPGWANIVTTHLHMEMLRPLPEEPCDFDIEARTTWLEDRFGLADGDIHSSDGSRVARVTIGSLVLGADDQPGPIANRPTPKGPARNPADPNMPTTMTFVAAPELGNSRGGVHGGVGALFAERSLHLALEGARGEGGPRMRPVEIRVAFIRRIAADGATIECRGRVAHLGRRLAATRGEVTDKTGRTALLADATYITY